MPTLEELVESGDIERLNDRLNELNTVEIAEELARLDPEQRAVPFRLLAKDRALEVFEPLDPADQQDLLDACGTSASSSWSRPWIPTIARASSTRCRPRWRAGCWPGCGRGSAR